MPIYPYVDKNRKCLICDSPCKIFNKQHAKTAKFCSKNCQITWQKGEGRKFGEKHHSWKGGRIKTKSGYFLVKAYGHPYANPHEYVFEHRLVAEKKLGRYLRKDEIVHHINGIKIDNRPENLVVMGNIDNHTHK